MRLTQWDGLGFAIRAVFRQHQWSKGHRDDLLGLPAVGPCSGDLGQLQKNTVGGNLNFYDFNLSVVVFF